MRKSTQGAQQNSLRTVDMFTPRNSSLPSLCNQKWPTAAKPRHWEHGWSQPPCLRVTLLSHGARLLLDVLRWASWGSVLPLAPLPCGGLIAKLCPTFETPWTVAYQSPLSMGFFPGKNTGVNCHFLLQGIFPTQELNPGLLCCRQILYLLSYQMHNS